METKSDRFTVEHLRTYVRVGTHDGQFHADDVFAVAALRMTYEDVILVRSRDPIVLASCDILADVGGEYNPDTNKFDHHQRGRAGARSNGVLYSSFGLVWQKFGAHLCGGDQSIADMVDQRMVQHIDMIDNGQHMFSGTSQFPGAQQFNTSTFVALLNPRYDEVPADYESAFHAALIFAEHALHRMIGSCIGERKARDEVKEACLAAGHSPVIVMNRFAPWQNCVHEFSAESAQFIVFPGDTGTWMVQAIPKSPGSFTPRRALPEAWGGLRDAQLQELTGVSDAVFCHPGLFICGAKTLAGAMRLAFMASEPV